MAAGDLVVADYQIEYGGLLLGATTQYGIDIQGLESLPTVQSADRGRLRRHGLIPGDDFLTGRTVIVTIQLKTGGTDFDTLTAALNNATRPGENEAVLVAQIPGVAAGNKIRFNARPRARQSRIDSRWSVELPRVAVRFDATDPRLYLNTQSSTSTGLATAATGLQWALTWPLNWGGASESGLIDLENTGDFSTPINFRIDGPATNPRIENVTLSRTLDFNITLAAGEYLEIDGDARSVLLNGTANRFSTLTTAQWFDLDPGTDQIRFAATASSAATLTATWRSAYV